MQPSDEIKSKLDIVDVIRDYIPLKAAGVNFRALCPFHHEKSPSFIVSPEKQIWHCFGCSKGGDLISFVMEMEGLSFVEAMRHLAPKAGVVFKKENMQLASQRNRLLDIIEFAARYYHKMLLENMESEAIRKYLIERGLKEETIEKWQIGYSPDSWDDLINLLKGRGYKENEIFLAGLSVKKEGTSRFYNRFRGRIMFPINDVNGNMVAFSARVNPAKEKEEKMGKYINSPGTLIYDKSKILFGLDKARQEIKRRDLAIIVEGQMDAITAHQASYLNVVASSGTALTAEQVVLLKRYTNNIALAFDMDRAGEMAADRGVKAAMKAEMSVKIIELPASKDPDECIKNNKAGWEEAVKNAKAVMQYYFDKTFAHLDLDKEENGRKAVKILLPVLAQLGSKMEQDFWLKKLSQTVNAREEILLEALHKLLISPVLTREESEIKSGIEKLSREEMLSELLIALMLKFPQLVEYAVNHIEPDQIASQETRTLYSGLLIYYNNVIDNWTQEGGELNIPQVNFKEFKQWLIENRRDEESREINEFDEIKSEGGDSQLKLLDKLALLGDKDFYNYEIEQAKNEIIKIIVNLKKNYLGKRREGIKKLITQAEKASDEEYLKELMEEFKILSDEIREIEILN